MAKVPKNRTRGKAGGTEQLSDLQKHILLWLLEKQEEIEKEGTDDVRVEFSRKGIKWGKHFFKSNRNKKFDRGNKSDSSKLSTSLRNLEKRRLVMRFPQPKQGNSQRTSHVKLNNEGISVAEEYRGDSRGWKEKRQAESQRRKQYKMTTEDMLEGW